MASKLAILGGKPAVPPGVKFLVWPRISKQDEKYVLASLRQDSHAWGPNCTALQAEFARWNGNKFCAATNSGTAALHMALAACDICAGDEVITTALSWTSSGTCMLHHNAIPIFVDVEWETMLLAPSRIEAAVTRKTRAIMPVHYWGVPCDMAAIMKIACKHNLHVIEDCCQAHGATFKDRKVGTMGHCNAFSLNQNKNFCGGEGGLLVTDDEAMYVKARALMSFGEMRAPEASRDFHSYGMGWMYRTNDLSAAFARSQLTGLDRTNALARENFDRVQDGLKGLPDVVLPFDTRTQRSNAYAYVVRVAPKAAERRGCELSLLRDATKEALRAEGVPVASARWMLPAHTVFQAKNGYGHGCPWRCGNARKGISYDLKQYPVTTRVVDSCIQVSINGHRPPNGARQINAIIKGVRKVFENLDQVPLEAARP